MAFGVAMCGIGMLTLTGDTISMDVFGPIADNANGIGEMGFNSDAERWRTLKPGDPGYLSRAAEQGRPADPRRPRRRRQHHEGHHEGHRHRLGGDRGRVAVRQLHRGAGHRVSEEKIGQLLIGDFTSGASKLTVAEPLVFIGMLIGGAVPFLFSAMTIRAVGRAAYLIVFECRRQFRDPDIMAGTKTPDYGRVVDICTATAQKELIGPGLLAIGTPLVVGFLLGPFALGGFLAGMILSGQLLAVFMSNAGGAWDNAKKMIEDEPRTRRRPARAREKHKASVTGDTVGDPLKDTSRPGDQPAHQGDEHGEPAGAAAGDSAQRERWDRQPDGGSDGRGHRRPGSGLGVVAVEEGVLRNERDGPDPADPHTSRATADTPEA